MDFIWGIDKEADIYCTSAKIAMNSQADTIDETINEFSKELNQLGWEELTYTQLISTIVHVTEEKVIESEWSITDEDGVAWILGILCRAYLKSLRTKTESFDKIFKDCFKLYFQDK